MLSVDGDADAAVEARIWIGWNKFRQLVPLLTNRDISLIRRGRMYSSCVQSSMLHASETWPVRKENEVALYWAEMRMVRWMCNVKVKIGFQVRRWERLGIDDIILILQQNRLQWYGHVLRKEDTDWVKKCMEYHTRWRAPDQEVHQRGHGQRLCKKIAKHTIWTGRTLWIVVDGNRWKKLIKVG